MSSIQIEHIFQVCIECGTSFSFPLTFYEQRLKDLRFFCCPNGHRQSYVRSEADNLRDKLQKMTKSMEFHRDVSEKRQRTIKRLERKIKKLGGQG